MKKNNCLDYEIVKMRNKINKEITSDKNCKSILKTSQKLDELIYKYYKVFKKV